MFLTQRETKLTPQPTHSLNSTAAVRTPDSAFILPLIHSKPNNTTSKPESHHHIAPSHALATSSNKGVSPDQTHQKQTRTPRSNPKDTALLNPKDRSKYVASRWRLPLDAAAEIVENFEAAQSPPSKETIRVARRWRISVGSAAELVRSFEEAQTVE
jgi:hypothetical protein